MAEETGWVVDTLTWNACVDACKEQLDEEHHSFLDDLYMSDDGILQGGDRFSPDHKKDQEIGWTIEKDWQSVETKKPPVGVLVLAGYPGESCSIMVYVGDDNRWPHRNKHGWYYDADHESLSWPQHPPVFWQPLPELPAKPKPVRPTHPRWGL